MSMRKMFRGKINRATVTEADLDYEGSITIDADLLDAANMLANEAVCIWNVSNGERFETYTVRGESGSGVICVNGAAAHKVRVGDLVIIASFGMMNEEEARKWEPDLAFVDANNKLVDPGRKEVPGPDRVQSSPKDKTLAATANSFDNFADSAAGS